MHDDQGWSGNRHYQPLILSSVPDGCERALDVGCGLGDLTRRLRSHASHVTGIDNDRRSIECARTHPDAGDIAYVHGDFLDWAGPPESFDLVTAVASLHHMDSASALQRMRDMLRPGGVLAILGLARGDGAVDAALAVPAVVGARLRRLAAARASGPSQPPGPSGYCAPVCWPPPATYRQMRQLAEQLLPGVVYRRHLYWRYSLIWTKPARRPAG